MAPKRLLISAQPSFHADSSDHPSSCLTRWLLVGLLCVLGSAGLQAQNDTAGDPTGTSGGYNAPVTTAGCYDAYNGNVKRVVTDVVVPGSNGTIPLAFTRTYNSRGTPATDVPGFADSYWRHSYQWSGVITTNTNGATVYMITYPDGSVVNFRLNRGTAPAGETFARGPVGTSDRLEIAPQRDTAHIFLHLADGTQVVFGTSLGYPQYLLDLYGAETKLTFTTVQAGGSYHLPVQNYTALTSVVEPGGRTLTLKYGTVYGQAIQGNAVNTFWSVISSVGVFDGSNNLLLGATYNYSSYAYGQASQGNNTEYAALTSVVYTEPSTSGGSVTAHYTYTATNTSQSGGGVNDTTPSGEPPLLTTCDDPYFAGPMSRIQYAYVPLATAGLWGVLQAEQNLTTGETVSALGQNNYGGPSLSTDTRGDHADTNGTAIARSFRYGEASTAAGTTNAAAFQPTTVTNFGTNSAPGAPAYILYNPPGSSCGQGYVARTMDALDVITQYTTEPYTGKAVSTLLPGGYTRKTTWGGMDGSASMPYFVLSTSDERGNQTTYQRYSNTGFVYEIDYPPGGGVERLDYTPFIVNGNYYYKVWHRYTKLGATITYNYGNNGGSGHGDLLISVNRTYLDTGSPGVAPVSHSETTTFHYDPLDRVDQTTDQRGVSDVFTYDGRHQLTQVKHTADNTAIQYVYDDYGRRLSVSDELTHVTTTAYDEYGRPTCVTQPVNAGGVPSRAVNRTYDRRDANNSVLGDALSHTSSAFSYTILASGRATQRLYTPNGWLSAEYRGQSDGNPANPDFPQCLRVSGNIGYDAVGHPLQVADAQGHVWQQSYDNCERPATATDPLGHATTTSYYPASDSRAGLTQSVTAPGNNSTAAATTTYTTYDAMGRCLGWTDAAGNSFGSAYDGAGDLTGQTDGMPSTGNGAHSPTEYAYDQLGRRGLLTYADGTYQQWTYDTSGNVATYRNRNGNTQTFNAYDLRNRPTGFRWDDGITGAGGVTGIAFDAAGRCTFFSNGYSALGMTYDDSGALQSEQQSISGSASSPIIRYTPDADGNVAQLRYPDGNVASWGFDYLDRVSTVSLSIANQNGNTPTLASYNYAAGQLANRETCAGVVTAYGYQANNRIASVWQYVNGGNNISQRTYGYYPNGQLSWFNKTADGGSSGSVFENNTGDVYDYWADGKLNVALRQASNVYTNANAQGDSQNAGASGPQWLGSYTYDAAGNRTVDYENGPTSQPAFDGENRQVAYGYSGDGDVTVGGADNGVWQYAYDANHQLLSAKPAPYTSTTASFVYDPLGRLCQRTVNGVTTNLYYAGRRLIEEQDASGNALHDYLYGQGGERVGWLDPGGEVTFLQYDARGFVTHLTDLAHNVDEQYVYDAWGQPQVYDATGTQSRGQASAIDHNRFLWARDYEWYPELGLYRCGARFYDPACGHWLQPDPIGQAGGLNLYTYCGNDPVNGVDPSGCWSWDDFLHPVVQSNGNTPTGTNIPDSRYATTGGAVYDGSAVSQTGPTLLGYIQYGDGDTHAPANPTNATLRWGSLGAVALFWGAGGQANNSRMSNYAITEMTASAQSDGFNAREYGRDQETSAVDFLEDAEDMSDESISIVGYSRGAVAALDTANTLGSDGYYVDNLVTIDPVSYFGNNFTVPGNVVHAYNFYETNGGLIYGAFHSGKFGGQSVNGAQNWNLSGFANLRGNVITHTNIPAAVETIVQSILNGG